MEQKTLFVKVSNDSEDINILPKMDEWEVYPNIAAAVASAAQTCGVASRSVDHDKLYASAAATMQAAREATRVLMREGLIPAPP